MGSELRASFRVHLFIVQYASSLGDVPQSSDRVAEVNVDILRREFERHNLNGQVVPRSIVQSDTSVPAGCDKQISRRRVGHLDHGLFELLEPVEL